jgi:uncharacterized membrane protein YraQ (UPF0718 family)
MTSSVQAQPKSKSRSWVIAVIVGVLFLVITSQLPILESLPQLWSKVPVFATIFLGIFIEAIPFLLLGTLGSGFVEAFLDHDQIQRLIPRGALLGALAGSMLGMIFPICECGVVPLTRRLFSKGLPVAAGIAFLLAAPVLNPIVILSTSAAFGWGWMLVGRIGLSMLIAVTTGLVFSVIKNPVEIMLPVRLAGQTGYPGPAGDEVAPRRTFREKLNQMAVIAADEFYEMGRFLILGAGLAAAMQTLIPQQVLLQVGHGPVTSVLVMLALAVILSICSTVDAFVVLGFVSIFSPGAILAFLIFGPMVDIKTTLMYLSVFKKRSVIYLILFPLLMSLLAGLLVNLLLF